VAACGGEPTALLNSGPSFNQQGPTEISASSSAEGQLIETFPWTIEKTADRDVVQLFEGDAAAARFTVALTRGDPVNVSGVADTVCVDNTGEFPTEALVITDKVQFHTGDEIWQDLEGATADLEPAEQIPAEGSQCYGLQILFEPQAGAVYRSFAQVTIGNFAGAPDDFPGVDSLIASFELPGTLTGEANRAVNVEDSAGESWLFEDSGAQTYESVFECGADAGDNDNVVTILETGQTAEARVTVECYALDVAKTVTTEFTRTYGWELEKASDTTALILPRGFPWDVDYTVSADTAGHTDSDASVSGTITIANPAPMAAQLLGVADLVSPDIELAVDCGVEFPVSLDADDALECTYAGDLPDVEERTNTVSATIQNYAYDADGAATESGTTDFSGSEAVTFGDPSSELDTCVSISDNWAGALGTACLADDELPKTFTYTSTLGAFSECGVFNETNVASFETSDNAATGRYRAAPTARWARAIGRTTRRRVLPRTTIHGPTCRTAQTHRSSIRMRRGSTSSASHPLVGMRTSRWRGSTWLHGSPASTAPTLPRSRMRSSRRSSGSISTTAIQTTSTWTTRSSSTISTSCRSDWTSSTTAWSVPRSAMTATGTVRSRPASTSSRRPPNATLPSTDWWAGAWCVRTRCSRDHSTSGSAAMARSIASAGYS
jgi:hypothetical protein